MDPRLDPSTPEAAGWYAAMTLDERVRLPVPAEHGPSADASRLEAWHASLEGLDVDAGTVLGCAGSIGAPLLASLLAETSEALQVRAREAVPGWLVTMLGVLAGPSGQDLPPLHDPPPLADSLVLFDQFLARGAYRLRRAVHPDAATLVDPLLADLLDPLRRRLARALERPLAMEVNVARLRGELSGDTAHERWRSFASRFDDPAARIDFLIGMPVLARLALRWVDDWTLASAELVEHVVADRECLEREFGVSGTPVRMSAADSDPHRGGRQVWFVDFDGGRRLVYKPRSVAAERGVADVVAELADLGLQPPLLACHASDRGDHGWLEFIEASPCETPEELDSFHERMGAWVAVMHGLSGTDIHFENLIARGSAPIPVDLETVMRARLAETPIFDADASVRSLLDDSIVGTELLPVPVFEHGIHELVDAGGMGHGYDHVESVSMPALVGFGTDELRVGSAELRPPRHPNRARIDGEAVDARDWIDAVERGYRVARELLRHHSGELFDPGRPLADLERCEVRLVLRPTRFYCGLLDQLGHPQYLRDARDAELVLNQLWHDSDSQSWRRPFIGSERAQLLIGDVPYFSTRGGSDDVVGGDGTVHAGTVLEQGGELARRRIRATPERAERELWVLRTSLATTGVGSDVEAEPLEGPDAGALALEVAHRLVSSATRVGETASWFGTSMVGGDVRDRDLHVPGVVGSTLYDGLPGIALALATIGEIAGDDECRRRAEQATEMQLRRHASGQLPVGPGAFDGVAGLAYQALRLGRAWDRPDLLDHAAQLVHAIDAELAHDDLHDVVSGAAGCIPVLHVIADARPGSDALEVLARGAERLVQVAMDPGVLHFQRGFSHGAAGIVWALTSAGAVLGDDRIVDAARSLAAHERMLFADDRWVDRMSPGGSPMTAWCHGAPGIALGRLLAWELDPCDEYLDDAHRALVSFLGGELEPHHGLCHGALGTIDVLLEVADRLGPTAPLRVDVERDIARRSSLVIDQLRVRGPRCSFPRGIEVPGLMNGLAGIAYGLQRIASPAATPSVLALAAAAPGA